MRAIQVQQDLTVRASEIERPRPGPGEALIRIHAAGVCGTDLHIVDGMIKPDSYPMTLGHEAAGTVEAAGPGVTMRAGARVAVLNKLFCGACEQCLCEHRIARANSAICCQVAITHGRTDTHTAIGQLFDAV